MAERIGGGAVGTERNEVGHETSGLIVPFIVAMSVSVLGLHRSSLLTGFDEICCDWIVESESSVLQSSYTQTS